VPTTCWPRSPAACRPTWRGLGVTGVWQAEFLAPQLSEVASAEGRVAELDAAVVLLYARI